MPDLNEELLAQIKKERVFVHDLATPIMIAAGMLDVVLNKMDESDLNRAKVIKAQNAVQKMADLLKNRRTELSNQTKQLTGQP